jgi:hypothetical protein
MFLKLEVTKYDAHRVGQILLVESVDVRVAVRRVSIMSVRVPRIP